MEDQSKIAIVNYKTGQRILSGEQLPVPFEQRISTDKFCTVLTAIFALVMLGIAIGVINLPALQKMTYPTDSQGRHCTLDNANYNYLYFPAPNNPAKRICLAQCPTGTEKVLECWPTEDISCSENSNPQFEVVIYPSEPSQTSLGLYCLPQDVFLRAKVLQGANLEEMFDFVSAFKGIGVSIFCGIGLGLMGTLLFCCLPTIAGYGSIILGGLSCLTLAVLLFITHSDLLAFYKVLVYLFGIVLIFVGIMLLWGVYFRQAEINLSIKYIKEAAEGLCEAPILMLVSFLFLVMLTGLIALCVFQILAYWSASEMTLASGSVYERPHSTFATIMTTLCAIEFLWGLCFLKQAFNFLIAGAAVTWHCIGDLSFIVAFERLIKFHWGSVVGGAFLLNLLYPIDLVYDLFKSNSLQQGGFINTVCCCCVRILDLCRTESMAMINLLGTPYCNSSRLCQHIVHCSNLTTGDDSANRFIRLGAHAWLAALATLFGWVYMNDNGKSSVLAVVLCFVINLFVLTFFVCLLQDMAQALLFCDLVDNYLDDKEQIEVKRMQSVGPVNKKLFGEGYEVIRTEERQSRR